MRLPPALLPVVALLVAAAPPESAPRYVPATGWRDNHWAVPFHEDWFSGDLQAMQEPPLATAGDLGPLRRRFRLLVLPTFDHPFAFRLDEDAGGRAMLREVMLDGRGGYAPGRIAKQSERMLTRHETAGIDRAIDAAKLKSLPMEAPQQPVRNGMITVCADGTMYVFELLDRNGRLFLLRGCFTPEKPLRTLIGALYALDPQTDWKAASHQDWRR
jgi:hypothetical protein